jgi:Cu2+-exporting ATPase
MPETALRMLADGRDESVSVHRLQRGDKVRVAVGQAFPADAELVQGHTRVDESLLTGESHPVPKAVGSPVVAGSLNLGAPVLARVDRVGADTRLESIVALMRDAMSQRPAIARWADRWAAPFLWSVLLLAGGAAAAWSVIEPARAVWVMVSVLIVTCPCALSLAVPATLLSASSALARRGVILQRLDALEGWTQLTRVYFDKTGTVTDERLQWRGLVRLDGGQHALDDAQLLQRAASLAAWSTHPLSRAVATLADEGAPHGWSAVSERPGEGLSAIDEHGRCWRLGSMDFVGAAGGQSADEASSVWMASDLGPVARLDFGETLRPDAAAAVAGLRGRGLEVVLLSGDRVARAEQMGRRLAVDRVIGGATPESKLAEIESAQASGLRVAMVGDGVNDAPVLARADVSLAMGQGALVARAQADAIVASSRLADLLQLHDLAHRAMRVVRQNLAWAAAYNLTCIPLALVGWLPPWAAGLGMASSSALVVLNALRLAR